MVNLYVEATLSCPKIQNISRLTASYMKAMVEPERDISHTIVFNGQNRLVKKELILPGSTAC
jgi:hypothetical protein